MAQIHISQAARRDLDLIWLRSVDQWSRVQVDRYTSQLLERLKDVLANPYIGRPVAIRPSWRKVFSGSHSIYYRLVDDGIEVVRVLHQSMDPHKHL